MGKKIVQTASTFRTYPMVEWRDGQPGCANLACSKRELKVGMTVVQPHLSFLIYCSSKCMKKRESAAVQAD